MQARITALTLALVASGCGGEDPKGGDPAPSGPSPLTVPLLRSVAPSAIRAGEEITIFGQGFADSAAGETRLVFEGVYQASSGKTSEVRLEVVPTYRNQGVLAWTFGPNIPFATEQDTGSFRGLLYAKNVGRTGEVKDTPQALGLEMEVLPSIIVRQMRPVSAACPAGITETIDDSQFLFELETVGLKAGSEIAPLRFVYTFMKENFLFSGYLANEMGVDPKSLFPEKGPVSVIDDVTDGMVSTLGAGAPRNVYVYKGLDAASVASLATSTDNLFGMTHLSTAPLPATGNYADAVMNILAIDSSGQQASRSIRLRVWTPVEVSYDGSSRAAQSFDPVPVSGCIPGGDIGRDVTYSESTADTRTRTFRVVSRIGGEVNVLVARLTAQFGFDVEASVSSTEQKSLAISGKILPREFGVFYRQTLQLECQAQLTSHGPCGGTQSLGEVVATNWTWSPDLAKGMACPPLPPSNLAQGQTF